MSADHIAHAAPAPLAGRLMAQASEAIRLICHPREWFTLNFVLQVTGASFGLGGQWLVGAHSANGFICWVISNTALIVLQMRMRLRVLIALHSVYLVLSVKAYLDWTRALN